MNPQVRTGLTHGGTALGAIIATGLWLGTTDVDMYALIKQANVIFTEIMKFIAMATPVATGAYGVYKASRKSKLEDIISDPKSVAVARELEPTPTAVAVADALKKAP